MIAMSRNISKKGIVASPVRCIMMFTETKTRAKLGSQSIIFHYL